MNKKKSLAVLFDLDGTLVDTAPDMITTLFKVINSQKKEASIPKDIIRNYVSDGSIGLIKLAFPDANESEITKLQQKFLSIYQNNLCIKTKVFKSLRNLLRTFEKHFIKWGVVTNKPSRMTIPLFRELNLTCKYIISGDTLAYRKPSPEPLILACNLMNIKTDDAIYIGDAKRDIEAGRTAGMKTICARYGYIKNEDNLESWDSDLIASSPSHLSSLIKKELHIT